MNYQHNNNPAKLNNRILFQTPPDPKAIGPDGYASEEWTDYKKVWAEIKTQRGYKVFNSDATQWQGKSIFGVRYHEDLSEEMRIVFKEKTYEIESIVNDDERNQWLTIIAAEVL
ncbi:phage head closure protein [Solibacillus sp. FSL H8-0538]|uniref:phage head closure protein n=1 Tax=Solibacillus sp. FSL H8-0538 TaxID=2921400 RepID=UPI0030F5D5D5